MSEQQGNMPHQSALFTDLYELTMMQSYYAEGMNAVSVFELFFRKLPHHRNFVMAAGLDDILNYLEHLRFTDQERDWLKAQGGFSQQFLEQLQGFRFTGDVFAVPEGTLVFENEPVVQVIAPLPEAQLVETYLLNQIHLQSVVATKAARVVSAARGHRVVDFGSRRAHGTDAALKVARTSYLAGASATSNVFASRHYNIPATGTMAHSFIQAHPDEYTALKAFVQEFPETTLLVDTYDTLAGVRKVIALAEALGQDFKVKAIRLDSGDLGKLAKESRRLLDEAGLNQVKIVASSGLDEYKIQALLEEGAPIDGFGVGTQLAVSGDAPELDFSYKLVEYANQPRTKLSSSKELLPGRKQVFRFFEAGQMKRDVIARFDETLEGQPLLEQVMNQGKRLERGQVSLEQAREHARKQMEALPPEFHALQSLKQGYPVTVSEALRQANEQLQHELEAELNS
ncbi:nicotinate phosphoribosyltransferase [Nitrosococcus halophilus Nc 4]|uniref:Nicotinate phosphoribosyltransferase n=1 Tax=Nitrosococcus halophilus (strain Nc4) TaxID=472759 RepID=D5BYR7_NITHN|nr:nicotinate phosphoribosyltransferase [Nitrosococcus halophilus]ADE16055.1 nicotinate phosphoribosyltransferase [Nitrosococcus halophilus Nc 4]